MFGRVGGRRVGSIVGVLSSKILYCLTRRRARDAQPRLGGSKGLRQARPTHRRVDHIFVNFIVEKEDRTEQGKWRVRCWIQ